MSENKHQLPEELISVFTIEKYNKTDKDLPFQNVCEEQSRIRAFTLLELIIAISIGTVVILLVSFAIRMGFFQVEKGSKWVEEKYRDNGALSFFYQQVTSMRSESINKDIIFDGDSGKIIFITPISLERSYGLGLMMAYYYIEENNEGSQLNYKEKRFVPGKNLDSFKDENVSMFSDSEMVEIVNGYDKISFQYLGLQENAGTESSESVPEWKSEWIENSLPKSVKVVLTKDGKRRELIAPVMVMY